jgi:hypothetical protein
MARFLISYSMSTGSSKRHVDSPEALDEAREELRKAGATVIEVRDERGTLVFFPLDRPADK